MISLALRAGLAAPALFLSAGALAQQAPASDAATGDAQAAARPESGLLSLEELAQLRGGETIVLNTQVLQGVTSGMLLGDYSAGTISLSDNALSNFNGVGNFVINTGALNTMQAGMTLTVNLGE
ncbi:hypothetical protein FHS95_000683 [Sphingomonas naasensis]|uniref:TonB-dependent receptor n=1 Tax=Sphingomonas naasensis TaxID=1344951 RepID=A0A4S1WS39_9SPHN|nr:hypothetical protein [Sphingomonas naasensis]NIJ19014.1 hypothetical protein [Sphingomonas naasensis]TGX46218.1 hypothetical protein E5A74_03415 [Sphingomonas naasensis]